ncbi:MAG: hydroxylamine dehydrogenase, partial [Candidatus Paceibacteria bacterium]
WHHEGRRARHGASMMGPDFTHWHGMYELAKTFYGHFIPELEELIEKAKHSGDEAKVAAAEVLEQKIAEILASKDHQWYLGEMDPEEADARAKASAEFKARYNK